jgi:transcriptional regulator with GAF, ATPase, and Fis domain
MIDEAKELSLKDSVSRIKRTMVRQAMKKHSDGQTKTAQSIGMTDRAIRHLLKIVTLVYFFLTSHLIVGI